MSETLCGKTCSECQYKEQLNCPGCKTGPGKHLGGECEIASCCWSKGHQECATCGFNSHCAPLRGSMHMPEYRLKKQESDAVWKAIVAKRAAVLGKWIWIIFWLNILLNVASGMTNQIVVTLLPQLYLPGEILTTLSYIASGVIFLILSPEESRYKTAGICTLVAGVWEAITVVAANGFSFSNPVLTAPDWVSVLNIPVAIVLIVNVRNEFKAHSAVLTGIDVGLSANWSKLWTWYCGTLVVSLASVLLSPLFGALSAIIVLAASLATTVISIIRLVYLYQTAKVFRWYAAEPEQIPGNTSM